MNVKVVTNFDSKDLAWADAIQTAYDTDTKEIILGPVRREEMFKWFTLYMLLRIGALEVDKSTGEIRRP